MYYIWKLLQISFFVILYILLRTANYVNIDILLLVLFINTIQPGNHVPYVFANRLTYPVYNYVYAKRKQLERVNEKYLLL